MVKLVSEKHVREFHLFINWNEWLIGFEHDSWADEFTIHIGPVLLGWW